MKKNMIITLEVNLDKKEYGITNVKSNTNIDELRPNAYEFMALLFEGLAQQYRDKLKLS